MPVKRELIYINERDETDRIVSYSYYAGKCLIVFKSSNKPYSYNIDRVRVVKTALSEDSAYNIFCYLEKIADTVGLKMEGGDNILAKSYQRISFIPKDCVLANYLNGRMFPASSDPQPIEIFPFGFNISQKNAVNTAFSQSLSVIEGPPGTGKTQTILNIIANAVMNGQSIAVVSSNNAATSNVYEKLEKSGIAFIAALLGNSQNKKQFIDGQTNVPDLSSFSLSYIEKADIKEKSTKLFHQLTECLTQQNQLALLNQELENIKTEYQHFQNAYKEQTADPTELKSDISARALLELWMAAENRAKKGRTFSFITRLIFRIQYGIKTEFFTTYSLERMIFIFQSRYYPAKISELTKAAIGLGNSLKNFSFDTRMKEYTRLSMQLLKAELYTRYNRKRRATYTAAELRSNSLEFIKDYPVVMSTTYSLRQSLSDGISYDYVIIDECSQVDLVTGALALSCAKRAVIVGDLKQLPNVVNAVAQTKTDLVFNAFNLPEAYRYSDHSLLASIMERFHGIPKTLLKEHYRCHPKIIEFCNKKFYNDELIVLAKQTDQRPPLIVYKTAPGNHARERMNQRQIDMIAQEIIPNEGLENVDLGIVTPYRWIFWRC